jgi:hypothetical protein
MEQACPLFKITTNRLLLTEHTYLCTHGSPLGGNRAGPLLFPCYFTKNSDKYKLIAILYLDSNFLTLFIRFLWHYQVNVLIIFFHEVFFAGELFQLLWV